MDQLTAHADDLIRRFSDASDAALELGPLGAPAWAANTAVLWWLWAARGFTPASAPR